MSATREALVLGAACALLYLTGTADIPFYTRGEPREGLVVREMLRRGEWLVPARPEGEPARKPPLYYWSAAPALAALPGEPERALRLPSAVLGSAAVLGTWAVARAVFGAAAGLPAGLVLATAFEWTRAATSARVDMALAAALTATLAGWLLALASDRRAWLALAAAGAALATLAKGPVGIALPALAVVVFVLARRERAALRRLRPATVLAVAAGAAGLWYGFALARGGAAFVDVVLRENWIRFLDTDAADTGHAHGVGYLLPLALVGVLPWTPLLPLALAPLRPPRPAAATLAAAWVGAGLVFFSLSAAKRSVYLLPLYPALALLVGAGIAGASDDGRPARAARLAARLYAPALLVLAAIAGALATGADPTALARRLLRAADAASVPALVAAARAAAWPLAALAVGTAAGALAVRRAVAALAWRRVVLVVAGLAVAWTATFDAWVHPAIGRARSVRAFLARVDVLVPPDAPLYARFPPDPGVRFYAPRELRPWPAPDGARPAHLLLWEDEWATLGGTPAPLERSEAAQARRGRLVLVVLPAAPVRKDSSRR
jgi:4-amino-4-deoxy-L-arabinose transferase-like glycosyltransferase